MKGFFISLFVVSIVAATAIILVMSMRYENEYTLHYASNAFFVVGLITLSFGVLTVTGASQIFLAMGYTIKNIFKKQDLKFREYLEAREERQNSNKSYVGLNLVIIGFILVVISFRLAAQV